MDLSSVLPWGGEYVGDHKNWMNGSYLDHSSFLEENCHGIC